MSDPELKRVPPPFAGDHPRAELLRRKGLSAWIDIDDPFVDRCKAGFRRLKPLFSWLIDQRSICAGRRR